MIAEEGSCQVLDGMESALSESRFAVGLLHADVESCYHFVAYLVLARYVDAAEEADVVDGKAGYGLHILILFCHSDDRREEESRKHKVDVLEILRFALDDSYY